METGKLIMEVLSWTVVAAIIVFVIMNASGIAQSVTDVGNWALGEQRMIVASQPYPKAA